VVEGDGFSRHLLDTSPWEGRNHGSEPNRMCGRRYRAEHHPYIGYWAISRWIVDAVPEEDGIPASRFGVDGEVGHHVRVGQFVEGSEIQASSNGG
jgi:hypothetical protein